MPSTDISLPLELEDMIIQHLSGDTSTLQSCALVSRTWSVFSQRVLFHNVQVDLDTYAKMGRFLDDLEYFPHLQTLIHGLRFDKYDHDERDISFHGHMFRSAQILSRLPNLVKIAFKDGVGDERETHSYLDLIPNILWDAPLVELDIDVDSVKNFHHVFDILEGTDIERVSLSNLFDLQNLDSGMIRERLHLPSLEHIHLEVEGLQEEFHNCVMHNFDLPNLKECEIVVYYERDLLRWHDVLLRGFLPLELFKLKLRRGFDEDVHSTNTAEEDAYRPLPLAGLPFRHVHLRVNPRTLNETRKYIEWWSSTFRTLSDSNATIHFTELTFAFTDLPGIETLEAAWNSLDDSLAHTTLSGIRRIHFERNGRRTGAKITQAAYPVLADKLRLALPQLASRGVLCFV